MRGEHFSGEDSGGNLIGESDAEESVSLSSNVILKYISLTAGSLTVALPPIFTTFIELSELNRPEMSFSTIPLPRELDISETKPWVIACSAAVKLPEKNRKNKESTDV